MSQIASIVIKRRKVISKRQKYPVHAIVLRKPAQIRSKNTTQFYSLYLYWLEYSDDCKSPAYFRPNILYLYVHDYRISVHHPRCKYRQKSPPHVTPLRCTTLHTKIQMYALVHKSLPRKPIIQLYYIFYVSISSTREQKIPPYRFHYNICMRISSPCNHNSPHPLKKNHKFLKHDNYT